MYFKYSFFSINISISFNKNMFPEIDAKSNKSAEIEVYLLKMKRNDVKYKMS